MILVTGATGNLGSLIVQKLQSEDAQLRLMTRDKNKLTDVKNVEVVEGNYENPDSLKAAFKGIERAFIISLHKKPGKRAKIHRNAFEAAANAGVNYIVYTSFQGAAENSTFSMARDHYQSEQYLKETGLSYTILRNSFYMEAAHEEVNENGMIRNPAGDGRVTWISRNDIAEVAAHLLLNPPSDSTTMDVTGPKAPKLSELARLLSDLSGISIEFGEESYEVGLRWRKQYGLRDWDLEAWISSDMAKGRGENARVSNTVERLLGRKACSLEKFYKQNDNYIMSLKDKLS